jgi:hypothetical protein
MEEDEPSHLRYEIAWVDNGSGESHTQDIMESFEIEHALPMKQNAGLAYGMNLLIFNLCTAPYILLLEEDWLYLDDLVATQTPRRKAAIATALALIETDLIAYDERPVMGVFLRPETYQTFMKFPFLDMWQHKNVDVFKLPSARADGDKDSCTESQLQEVSYQIVCSDPSTTSMYIWGSYTNGSGLYRRKDLIKIGRMYGEPGDAFHDRYVESNYAYRAGLKFCHAAIQLGDCRDLAVPECTAAFYHIGGGRGTRPMKSTDTKCASQLWNFVGTPIFHRYLKLIGQETLCSRAELDELKDLKQKERDAAGYRQEVREMNKALFEEQQAERDRMIEQAKLLLEGDKDWIRQNINGMTDYTDEEIIATATRMGRLARSPHPLEGYWDSHGRPLKK